MRAQPHDQHRLLDGENVKSYGRPNRSNCAKHAPIVEDLTWAELPR
jgi:hypothetical protein